MPDYGAATNDPDHYSTLTEIMHLVNVPYGVTLEGWNQETARLFAIDTAMTATRRHMATLTEADRHSINAYLQEARTLVVAGRDSELGFLQAALESHLALAVLGVPRRLWLGAIDALIPSPYRAALVSTRNALSLGTAEAFTDLSNLLRDRLLARLGEGSLLSGPPSTLFLIA